MRETLDNTSKRSRYGQLELKELEWCRIPLGDPNRGRISNWETINIKYLKYTEGVKGLFFSKGFPESDTPTIKKYYPVELKILILRKPLPPHYNIYMISFLIQVIAREVELALEILFKYRYTSYI